MAEQLAPMLIFSVTFLGITLVIMATLGQLFAANAMSEDISSSYDVIGGKTYTMWHEEDYDEEFAYISGANVTEWSSWVSEGLNSINSKGDPGPTYPHNVNGRAHFTFYDQAADPVTKHRLDVWIVRNNTEYYKHLTEDDESVWLQCNKYRDFMLFREYKYSGAWYDNHNTWYGIRSFEYLLSDDNMMGANQTRTSFLGRTNTTIFFSATLTGLLNVTSSLYSNSGVVQVGTDTMNLDLSTGKIGALNLVGDLLLFKLPGVPVPVNYIIGLPLWIMISLTIVALVSRFIPTIPGL